MLNINKVKSLIKRSRRFSKPLRILFFTNLAEYERGNLSINETLKLLVDSDIDAGITEVSELCLAALAERKPIGTYALSSGYFSEEEARLLDVGIQYKALAPMCELLLARMNSGTAFFRTMLFGRIGDYIGILFLIWLSQTSKDMRKFAGKEDNIIFILTDAIWNNLLLIGVAYLFYLYIYYYIRDKTSGAFRERFKKFGFFSINDREVEYTLLSVFGALCKTNVQPNQIYITALTLIPNQRYIVEQLSNGLDSLSNVKFSQGLQNLFSKLSYLAIRAKSPAGDLVSIGDGCLAAEGALRMAISLQITTSNSALQLINYVFIFLILYPLIMMYSGVGFKLG